MRVGIGTDIHAFDAASPMWLGCVEWPGIPGLSGHSDGDAVAHAVCDALFSAAGLGDMGSNFGVDRPEYANASGAVFLSAALELINAAGFAVGNVAVQVIAHQPKIATRRGEMEAAVSQALGWAPVAISGTTSDGLGFTGEGKGLCAIATCVLLPIRQ